MQFRFAASALALIAVSAPAFAQTDRATDITNEQIQKVLKEYPNSTDHTLKVVDLGAYQVSVAVVKRGPTRDSNAPASARPAAAANAPAPVPCGVAAMPTGSKPAAPGGISHDFTDETYIVISGSGTLVTGGEVLNGRRSGPDSEVTIILNGPSCSGAIVGNYVARVMRVGDISFIPAGVAHGWTNIGTEVTYLSVRPDPKKVLEHGYVHPAIK